MRPSQLVNLSKFAQSFLCSVSRQVYFLINTSFQCDLTENELCCKISVCFKVLPNKNRNETLWGRHGLSGWGHIQAAPLYVPTEVRVSKCRVWKKEGLQVIKEGCISWLMAQAVNAPRREGSLKAAARKRKNEKEKLHPRASIKILQLHVHQLL